MRSPLLFVGCVLAALISGAAAGEGGSEERTIELKDFTAIEVSGAYELDVEVGGDYSIRLSGPPEEMQRAEATVENGTLVLDTKKRLRGIKHHGDRSGLSAEVTMPTLDRVMVSGVTDADIRGVDAGAFKVNLSGVGEVTIAGRCGNLHARVSGVGELNAEALRCGVADVSLSGMGEAAVFAREAATAEVSGMGEINIYGSPKKVEKRGGYFAEINVH
ncbi:MAG: DUF2807 domain-containing protein [Parvularculaceae bacterium]|nr:DUF2807 domain-containing protein [Parvularculaceae bacterium]